MGDKGWLIFPDVLTNPPISPFAKGGMCEEGFTFLIPLKMGVKGNHACPQLDWGRVTATADRCTMPRINYNDTLGWTILIKSTALSISSVVFSTEKLNLTLE